MTVRSRNYKIIVQRDSKELTTRVIELLDLAEDFLNRSALFFSSRDEMVAQVGSYDLKDGSEVIAEGLGYVAQTGATQIADLPGFVPVAPLNLRHWGVTYAASEGEAVIDYTSRVRQATAVAAGQLDVDGFVFIRDSIEPNIRCKLNLTTAPDRGGFVVRSDFNLAAQGVIVGPSAGENWALGDMAIHCDQSAADASGLRADFVRYPWPFRFRSPRPNVGNLRISRGYDGIGGAANLGGMRTGRLELGCVGMIADIDGLLDFAAIDQVHIWPFGMAARPNLANIFYDGQAKFRLGKVEGLVVRQFGTFRQGLDYEGDPEGILPAIIMSLQLDGRGARYVHKSGWSRIAMSYSTKNGGVAQASVRQEGGFLDMTNPHFAGDELVMLDVAAGVCTVNGGHFYNPNPAGIMARVGGGGRLILNAPLLRGKSGVARTAPAIQQLSGGILEVVDPSVADMSAAVDLVEIQQDNPGNRVDVGNLRYHQISLPANATQGSYIVPAWVAGGQEVVFSTRAQASAYVNGGRRFGIGQIIRVGDLKWQYDGASTLIADMLGCMPLKPEVGHWGSNVAAITAMSAAMQYLRFTKPFTLNANATIDVPVSFDFGANIGGAFTLTITNDVDSQRQQIFRNDLTVVLGNAAGGSTGEDAREVHASWFGAFPSAINGSDQGPAIARAFAAMGNTRESIVEFDVGNYNVGTTIPVTRGGMVKGDGERRTVFKAQGDFPLFVTQGVACYFQDIQFEDHTGVNRQLHPWIKLDHGGARVRRVQLGSAAKNIVINATDCVVEDFGAVWASGFNTAGSSLIEVNAGQTRIRNGYRVQGNDGVEVLIRIGTNATGTLSAVTMDGLDFDCNSIGVYLDARNGSLTRLRLTNILYSGGSAIGSIVRGETNGTFTMDRVIIDGVQGSGAEARVIDLQQKSTGAIRKIMLNNMPGSGSTGTGIRLERTAGTLEDISIGSGVDMASKAIGLERVGTIGTVRTSNAANVGTVV